MSYGLIYTLPFNSIDGKDYTIKIEKEGYQGVSAELKGQSSPFTVTLSDEEFVYTPTRFSTATLHIFGGDYLQDLFSTDYRMCRVTLYEGERMIWRGFIKPEIYTQDYRSVKFNLDLECYSAMSVLEYVDYEQKNENRGFVTLWDLLQACIEESHGEYQSVYLPHVYGADQSAFDSWSNPLSDMSVSEQNFFDEDDNPMTYKEVLEEIMKLLNWTCVDYMGDLYFVDINNTDGEYYKYTGAGYSEVQTGFMSVQDIGFSGDGHTLDIAPGYNKVTIRCSNYPVGDALPDLAFDKMVDIAEFTANAGNNSEAHYKVKRAVVFSTNAYLRDELGNLTLISIEDEKKLDFSNGIPTGVIGCIPLLEDRYDLDSEGNPLIVDYDYTEYLNIPTESMGVPFIYSENNKIPIIEIKGVSSSYTDGAFYINFDTVFGAYVDKVNLKSYDFHFQLRIGKDYYHGKSDGTYFWDTNPEINDEYDNNLIPKWTDGTTDLNLIDKTYPLGSSRKLGDKLDGTKGYICKLPDNRVLSGDLELKIYGPCVRWSFNNQDLTFPLRLSGFEFAYTKYSTNDDSEDSDRTYENVVNENYINELDEIELKISSYNNDGACYSKVLIGDKYLKDNLYCGITGTPIRPEELLIRRIVDYYSATKLRLTEVLKRADITPFTRLTDRNQPGKYFLAMGGEIDYKMNSFKVIMVEVV